MTVKVRCQAPFAIHTRVVFPGEASPCVTYWKRPVQGPTGTRQDTGAVIQLRSTAPAVSWTRFAVRWSCWVVATPYHHSYNAKLPGWRKVTRLRQRG